jgi:chorismate-pyruvate lyase
MCWSRKAESYMLDRRYKFLFGASMMLFVQDEFPEHYLEGGRRI